MVLAQQLKVLMKKKRMTVSQLSSATGVPAKTLYHYLEGRTPRNLDHVRKVCEVLKVSADYLLFGAEIAKVELEEVIAFGTYDVFLKKKDV